MTESKADLAVRGDYPPEPAVIFFAVDGRRVGRTQHTLSYLAGYSGRGERRLTVGAFTALVTAATGLAASDLLVKPWSYDLRCASGTGERVRTIKASRVPGRKIKR
jgi:hypothetical protein